MAVSGWRHSQLITGQQQSSQLEMHEELEVPARPSFPAWETRLSHPDPSWAPWAGGSEGPSQKEECSVQSHKPGAGGTRGDLKEPNLLGVEGSMGTSRSPWSFQVCQFFKSPKIQVIFLLW